MDAVEKVSSRVASQLAGVPSPLWETSELWTYVRRTAAPSAEGWPLFQRLF